MNLFKQFTRRAAVLLLCLSMVTGLVLPAFAATSPAVETPEPTPATSFEFSAGEITDFIGDETDVVIPAKINGETVTKIGQASFMSTDLETLVVPSTVTYVDDYAFDYDYSLTDIFFYGALPGNLESATYDMPTSVTIHCKQQYLSDYLKEVGDYFSVSGNISNSLEDPAYPEAPSHNWVYTDNGDGTHSAACADDGCTETITNEAHTFEKGVCVCGAKVDPSAQEYYKFELRDGKAWITGYYGFGGEITLPTKYTVDGADYEVVGVAEGAFCGNGSYYGKTDSEAVSQITKITVPASITTVERMGFYYVGRYMTKMWQLKEIVFEAENVTFGDLALGGNPNLTTVVLPAKLDMISASMFSKDEALTTLNLPATVDTIGKLAFQDCTALTTVTFNSTTAPGLAVSDGYDSGRYPFVGCKELVLSVPISSLSAYQTAWAEMLNADTAKKGDITLSTWGEADPIVAHIPDFKVYLEGSTTKYIEYHVTSFDNATKTGKVEVKYVGYNSNGGTLDIPETVTTNVVGKPWTFTVTGIGKNAMYSYEMDYASSNYWFATVNFPSTLEYIDKGGCWSLERVTEIDLSNTKVHTLGTYAFYGCIAAKTVKLPATLEKMGTETSTITIGEDDAAQKYTYTENVFACCDALENIYVDEANPNFKDVDGILYTKDGKKLVRYPNARPATHFDIPEGVEVIASQAFMQSYRGKSVLETVSFPSTIKSIESLAFRQSNLTSVTLPPHTTFGTSVFDISKKLASVTIPEGVEALGEYMFWSCEALTEVSFPDSLKTVGESCFGHTGLTKVDLNKVESLGSYAFYICDGLTEITIPNTANEIGTAVFAGCQNITKATFAEGAKTIGRFMFSSCTALADLTLVDSIESIGEYAFAHCVELSEITLPKSLKEMGDAVFYKDWKNLTKVVFPDEVRITELPASTFESCQALTYVYLGKNIAATGPVSLYDTNANIIIDCAVAEDHFLRSPFDVFPYDLNDKELFAKWEAQAEVDSNGYPVYKVWLTQAGESSGCGGGGATITDDDGNPIAYIYSGATPTFRFGSATPEEPVVLTVLEQYEGETATTVKTYTLSELKVMAKSDLIGYQYFNHATKVEGTVASNLYATVSDLLADAGIDFGAGDSVTANTAAADFASTLTYEDSEIYKYYINAEGKTEVPPAILISWNSGTGTPEELIKGAYISGNFRFAYGISQEQYDSQNVSGKRLASQVATLTVTHPERVVLNVYEQTEGSEAKLVKGYKPSELAALKTEGTVGYQYWKSGEETILAATEYVTIDNLLTDAGLTFAEGDTLQAAAADGFSGKLTYAESLTNKYFFTNDNKTEVPAALALNWNTGKGTLEEVAATAKNTGNIRFAYGVSEQQFADKSAAGKRLVSKVASVTVIHEAACKHPTTEVVNAKPATCTEDGYTGDLVCTVCGVVIGQGEVIPANCPGAIFSDMPAVGNWAHVGIDYCVKAGLFNGVAADRFAPDGEMTRAMLVTVLWRMSGSPKAESDNPFTDVAADSWYADAVVWAAENKIVLGVGNSKFDPDASVTREQIATILFRYAQTNGVDVAERAELKDFPDSAEVSEWAAEALQWAVAAKLVNGSEENGRNYLLPQGAATRAQLAAILMRYEQNFAK